MAIFNESFLDRFKKDKKDKQDKKTTNKTQERKHGILTREDAQNAINLIKQVIGSNKEVGKYLEVEPIDSTMKKYNESSVDSINIATLFTMDPDDENNRDVLIPHEDASWFKGDWEELSYHIDDVMDGLNDKLTSECEKKYGDSFEFGYSSSYYAYYYHIFSKKPKNSDGDK